jgi:NADH dehydrogenase
MPGELERSLTGVDVLVNAYWIRFDRGQNTQARAVQNTAKLIAAAASAGVSRVVHVSITNPALDSPLSYFRGKALNELTVMGSSMSYAILRPTVLFGREDILINNIAFLLRHFPVFFIAGDGRYRIQPVFVDDLAALVEQAVFDRESYVVDAVGPEVFSFRDLVELIGARIGVKRAILPVTPAVVSVTARLLGTLLHDKLLTGQELDGLMANLLVSSGPARCPTRLSGWLAAHAADLGATYASELKRHYL